jgi:hypothetical protein
MKDLNPFLHSASLFTVPGGLRYANPPYGLLLIAQAKKTTGHLSVARLHFARLIVRFL